MPHRKDLISDFNDTQRQELADLIKQFLTDAIVAEHILVAAGPDLWHPNHEQFFQNHRAYIAKLEGFLMNHDGQQFVPFPKWDDRRNIPDHFWAVKPKDNGTSRGQLNSNYDHLPPPVATLCR